MFLALLIYVDDILIMSSNDELVTKVKEYLHSLFTIKDLRVARYLLGTEVIQREEGMHITQIKYITDMLKDAGLSNCILVNSPIKGNNDLATLGEEL